MDTGQVVTRIVVLRSGWVTDETTTLKESRGKVVVALFRRPGDNRAAKFLQELDRYVKTRGTDGLVGLTACYFSERSDSATELKEFMRSDLSSLDVSLPAGIDGKHENASILRGVHAIVGPSSTFLVFNRKGEQAWYLPDPKANDVPHPRCG